MASARAALWLALARLCGALAPQPRAWAQPAASLHHRRSLAPLRLQQLEPEPGLKQPEPASTGLFSSDPVADPGERAPCVQYRRGRPFVGSSRRSERAAADVHSGPARRRDGVSRRWRPRIPLPDAGTLTSKRLGHSRPQATPT